MKTVTITEIRDHLKAKGKELTKLKLKLNGSDAYEVSNGDSFRVYTAYELKEAYQIGAI